MSISQLCSLQNLNWVRTVSTSYPDGFHLPEIRTIRNVSRETESISTLLSPKKVCNEYSLVNISIINVSQKRCFHYRHGCERLHKCNLRGTRVYVSLLGSYIPRCVSANPRRGISQGLFISESSFEKKLSQVCESHSLPNFFSQFRQDTVPKFHQFGCIGNVLWSISDGISVVS